MGLVTLPPPPPPTDAFVEAPVIHNAVAAERSAIDTVDTYVPPASELSSMFATVGIGTPSASSSFVESTWWKDSHKEMDVDLNGHDFDFKPKRNIGKERVEGEIDGPFSHNGWFRVLENRKDFLEIEVKIGTNDDHDNDVNVVLTIDKGKVTVTGTIGDEDLPSGGASSLVTGSGTKADP